MVYRRLYVSPMPTSFTEKLVPVVPLLLFLSFILPSCKMTFFGGPFNVSSIHEKAVPIFIPQTCQACYMVQKKKAYQMS